MKNETVKAGMKIGATIGGLVFLVFGIMPGFYFGSYGTLILLQKIMGGAVEPTLFVRAAIVMGIVVGIACAATVSLVVGGLLGTAAGYVVSIPSALKQKEATAEKAPYNQKEPRKGGEQSPPFLFFGLFQLDLVTSSATATQTLQIQI
jgi:hypothetical protein